MAGHESGIPFPPDPVGVFYLVAAIDDWDHYDRRNRNVDRRVDRRGTCVVDCSKIIKRATVKVAIGTRADTGVRQSHGSTRGSTIHTGGHGGPPLRIKFVFMPIDNIVLDIFSNAIEICFITYDVFIIITLPQFFVK